MRGGESVSLIGSVFEKVFAFSAESYHGELLQFGAPAAHVNLQFVVVFCGVVEKWKHNEGKKWKKDGCSVQ